MNTTGTQNPKPKTHEPLELFELFEINKKSTKNTTRSKKEYPQKPSRAATKNSRNKEQIQNKHISSKKTFKAKQNTPSPEADIEAQSKNKIILKKLNRCKKIAIGLDCGFALCGIKFGWDPIIGLVPVFGDMAGLVIASFYALGLIQQFSLPFYVIFGFIVNILIDALIGVVPVVGDIADMLFKANMRNYYLAHSHLSKKYNLEN
ncbi:hypothetical protein BB561_005009 [Smittium simulii]|uniref:DUF4112 domain-containing protein n=1 Tax=Smittium simulii TaxID=133385 RepID=A0A2T9YCR9_9FUNG|nr:hypothetical protein BB561_005009 [Smittium simulii]